MPVYHVSGLAAAIRNLCGGSASKSFFLFCCEKHTITPPTFVSTSKVRKTSCNWRSLFGILFIVEVARLPKNALVEIEAIAC